MPTPSPLTWVSEKPRYLIPFGTYINKHPLSETAIWVPKHATEEAKRRQSNAAR